MTKPANSKDKPSPADTPTKRPNDDGGKAKIRKTEKEYNADKPHSGDISKRHETEEQPVQPVTRAPNA